MNPAFAEALTGLGLFVAFFGVPCLLFGAFRFWQVFLRPARKRRHRKWNMT